MTHTTAPKWTSSDEHEMLHCAKTEHQCVFYTNHSERVDGDEDARAHRANGQPHNTSSHKRPEGRECKRETREREKKHRTQS